MSVNTSTPPRTEPELRAWLVDELWVPYAQSETLEEAPSGWQGRYVTRWIRDGFGGIEDAVETYRRHGHLLDQPTTTTTGSRA